MPDEMAAKSTAAERAAQRAGAQARQSDRAGFAAEPGALVLVCLAAWTVPGAGHFWLGRRQKAAVFCAALLAMFAIGLALHGRIFPFAPTEPLVALAAIANLGLAGPWLAARILGAGDGTVTAVTYEYGNSFLIVAGLLNFLVMLDAFDIGMGRK
jgi:hypothetical protein